MVIGPIPPIGPRASRKFLPATFPPTSATTEWKRGLVNNPRTSSMPISADGRSHGKLCSLEIALKASKQIDPQISASPGAPVRRTTVMLHLYTSPQGAYQKRDREARKG